MLRALILWKNSDNKVSVMSNSDEYIPSQREKTQNPD